MRWIRVYGFLFGLWTSALLVGSAVPPKKPSERRPSYNGRSDVIVMEKELHIGAMFPVNGTGGWLGGKGCLPAARMALKDVNAAPNLLSGYNLSMPWNDSEGSWKGSVMGNMKRKHGFYTLRRSPDHYPYCILCSPGLGANVMYDLLYNDPKKLMLVCGCSIVCSTIAEAAKMWNLVVVSYGSSSPALSTRNRFPTFFRTHPSATIHNPTRIKLFQKFQWSRIAIILEAEEVFISTGEDLEARCKESKIDIVTRQSFLTDPTDAVRNLVRQDARIIVGMFYSAAARQVICEAYKTKVYGKQYVWFLIGWYEDDWYAVQDKTHNCTVEEMKEALEGHLTTEALMLNQGNESTISGMTSEQFLVRYEKELDELVRLGHLPSNKPVGFQEAPLAYDAIWAIALALNKTIGQLKETGESIEHFTYEKRNIAQQIYSAMNSTQFLGVSGQVAFSSKGDRIARTLIEQMINGTYNVLGYYDIQTDELKWIAEEKWEDGRPPPDRTIIVQELRKVTLSLFISMCTVASVGIVWALALLIFNLVYRHSRYIALSHPNVNNIILIGIICCLICVCLLGLDGQFVSPENYPHMCQARAWMLTIGFTLSYGTMFSKIWRVHRLTTKSKTESKKVASWKLYLMVCVLLGLDIIILLAWQVADPLQRKLEMFPLEAPQVSEDIKIEPQLEHCESENNSVWLGLIYGYKGLLLIFGIFLAYETRSVKIKQLNDSRLVGMSIYNVVVLCLITAPVTLVISSQTDATFGFMALSIIFCCFLSMALIFIPKIMELIRRPRERMDARTLTDTINSREDEYRHQRLLQENEELKKQISEREEQIRMMTQALQEKNALRNAQAISTGSGGRILGGGAGGTDRVRIAVPGQFTDGIMLAPPDRIIIDPTSDSGFITGTSMARSSRGSHSDFEFSESYL